MDSSKLTLLVSVAFWLLPSPFKQIKKWLTSNEVRRIVFEHNKLRTETKKAIHAEKTVEACKDGECAKI